jgi:hypothetical protein
MISVARRPSPSLTNSSTVVTTLTSGYGLGMAQRAYEISAQLLTRRLVIDLGYVVASRCPRH